MEPSMGITQQAVAASWSRWDRVGLWLMLVGASVIALLSLVVGIIGAAGEVVSGTRHMTLITEQPLPAAASTGSATLVDGYFDTARLGVADLSAGTAGLLTAGSVLGVLVQTSVALCFAYLAWRLLRAKPFMASLTATFVAAGAALAVGGLVGQFLTGFGQWNAALELGGDGSADDPFWPLVMSLDAAPIGLGFALLIVASAFQYGERLARETDGLV
jgi:hypothetical protein